MNYRKLFFVFLLALSPFLYSDKKESSPKQNQKKIAILIGINHYGKEIEPLNYSASDSEKMKAILDEEYEIILLNDHRSDEFKPTYRNFQKQWEEALKKSPTTLLFYFSGHGFLNHEKKNALAMQDIKLFEPTEDEAKNEIFFHSENAILVEKLTEDIANYKIPKAIFLLDACRTSVPLRKDGKLKGSISGEAKSVFEDFPPEVKQAKGVAIITASEKEKPSKEYNELEGGLFTEYVVKALSGEVQDQNPEEYVTVEKLLGYTKDSMSKFQKKKDVPTDKLQAPSFITKEGKNNEKILILEKRPKDLPSPEEFLFFNRLKEKIRGKLTFYKNGFRKKLQFFQEVKKKAEGEEGYLRTPRDLDGIAEVEYEYEKNKKFFASQRKLGGDAIEFKSGLLLRDKSDGEKRAGWYYAAPTSDDPLETADKEAKFVRRTYDFNGNLLKEETYKNQKDLAPDESGIARSVRAYDINGNKTLEEYYDKDNQLTENSDQVARYVYTYDTNGRVLSEEFFGKDGNYIETKDEGIARVSYSWKQYTEKGKIIWRLERREYRGKDLKLKNKKGTRLALVKYKYDSQGRITEQAFFDEEEKPTNIEIEVSPSGEFWEGELREIGIWTDEKAKKEEKERYKRRQEEEKKLLLISDILQTELKDKRSLKIEMSKREWKYDERGNLIRFGVFQSEKEKVRPRYFLPGGIAEIRYGYDEKNNLTEIKYIGESGNAVGDESGASVYTKLYNLPCIENLKKDKQHCVAEYALLRPSGESITDKYGVGRYVFFYDKEGYVTEERYYKSGGGLEKNKEGKEVRKGELVLNTEFVTPVAVKKRKYNPACLTKIRSTHDCLADFRQFDTDQNLISDSQGVAIHRREFDEKGNLVSRYFLDATEKPVEHKSLAYYKEEWKKESGENQYSLNHIYYGKDNQPKENVIFDRKLYSKKGKLLKEEYYTIKEGKEIPGLSKYGYSAKEYSFYPTGFLQKEVFLDIERKPYFQNEFGFNEEKFITFEKVSDLKNNKVSETRFSYQARLKSDFFLSTQGKGRGTLYLSALEYLENGKLAKREEFFENEKLKILETYQAGNLSTRKVYRESGELFYKIKQEEGYYTKTAYNTNEEITEEAFVDASENYLIPEGKTYARKTVDRKKGEDIAYWGVKAKEKAVDRKGIHRERKIEKQIEGVGYCVIEENLGKEGKFVPNEKGMGKKETCYKTDQKKEIVLKIQFGSTEKELVAFDANGVAKYQKKEVEVPKNLKAIVAKRVEEAYYGKDGKLIPYNPFFTHAYTLYDYNKAGQLISDHYYNKDKKPTLNVSRYHKREMEFDERGRLKELKILGVDGKLTDASYFPARLVKKYSVEKLDKKELSVENTCAYGANGTQNNKPCVVKKFDGKNLISIENFLDGKAKAGYNGISKTFYKYDKNSRRIHALYQDASGNLKENARGVARETNLYDDKGKLLKNNRYNHLGLETMHTYYFPEKKKIKERVKYRILSPSKIQELETSKDFKENNLRALPRTLEERWVWNDPEDKIPSIYEKADESGRLVKKSYTLYFDNPRGSSEKRLIRLRLDKYFRPKSITFIPENSRHEEEVKKKL